MLQPAIAKNSKNQIGCQTYIPVPNSVLQPTIIGGKSGKTINVLNNIVEYIDFKRNYVSFNNYSINI